MDCPHITLEAVMSQTCHNFVNFSLTGARVRYKFSLAEESSCLKLKG